MHNKEKLERNFRIDLLRAIGLAMIVLAHVGSYGLLFQLRNFDVPLMVLVSGMSFILSYKNSEPFMSYIWKRFKRLVLPIWIFLTCYFTALIFLSPYHSDLNITTIINSYSLKSGIGYVWIIKVFFLVALISPFIFNLHCRTKSNTTYFLVISAIFIAYEIIRYFSLPYIQGGTLKSISLISHYIVPYGLVFAIGIRIPTLNYRQVGYLSATCLLILLLIGVMLYSMNGEFMPTQEYKYPPSFYYLSYAIFVSCLLWIYAENIEDLLIKIKIDKLISFIGRNSIWIYLWHIPVIKFYDANFIIKYMVALSVSIFITKIQATIVHQLTNNKPRNTLNKNLKILFTG